jgi:LysR family transcriptional regulator for bpeEF and oprC
LAGIGIVQMASYSIDPQVAAGQLELVLDDWISTPLPVNVVYPQNRHLSAKVRVFVEWVAELFTTNPRLQIRAPARRPVPVKA